MFFNRMVYSMLYNLTDCLDCHRIDAELCGNVI